MDVTLTGAAERFGVGTSVSVWPGDRPPAQGGSPPGSSVATAVVGSGGTLAFTGLTPNLSYVAYAPSPDRYMRFFASAPVAPGRGRVIEDESLQMAERAALAFQGDAVVVTDDPTNDRSIVAIKGAPVFNVKDPPFNAKGDGTADDTAAIQAALNAVPSTGGKVVGSPGSTFVAENLQPKSNTVLADLKLLHKASSASPCISVGSAVTDVTIQNVEIDGNSASQSNNVNGITVGGTRNRVTGCYLHAIKYDGVYVNASSRHIGVDNCRVDTTGRYGVTIGGNTAGVDEPYYVRISNNTVRNTNDGGCGIVGVARHVVFAHNVIENTVVGDGIAAYNRDNFNIAAIGNVTDTTGNHGIHLGGNRLTVTGNAIYNPNYNGIMIASDPNGSPTASQKFVVSGNMIDAPGRALSASNGMGIEVEAMSYGSVSGNTITAPYSHGINIDVGSTLVSVTGNTVRSSTVGSGIRISKTSKATIQGNISSGNAAAGIAITDDAVTLSTNIVVSGNFLANNTGFGINVISTAKVTIGHNDLLSNAGGDISTVSTSSVVAQGNTDVSNSIASAATISPPHGMTYVIVTGTTNITGVSSAARALGRIVMLKFTGILTVTNGSNLVLNGNFTTAANSTLTLMCDGLGNWFEIARKA